jgi:ribosomal protein S2
MIFFNLNYNQLLLYGIHVGHSLSNTLLYSAWMISAFRQSISIINLFKSIVMFRISFLVLTNIVSVSNPVWFVNLDKSADRYVKHAASSCGEFAVTSTWIRGAISNYRTVFNAYRGLSDLPKVALSAKKRSFKVFFQDWFLTRYSWPRAIFISSLHTSYAPAKEALLTRIPCISIVDTNSWTQTASIAIPGNDESLGCLVFYNDIISNFILSKKFNAVSVWFFNVRAISRIVNFIDWLTIRYSLDKNIDINNLITFKPNMLNSYIKSMSVFLSKNYWSSIKPERLTILHSYLPTLNFSSVFHTFLNRKTQIIMSLNLHFFKKVWLYKGFF